MKRKQHEIKKKNIQKKTADPIENILKLLEINENNVDIEKSKPKHMKEKEKITKVNDIKEINDFEEKETNPKKNYRKSDKREEITNKKNYEPSKEDSEDLLNYLDELDDDNKINYNDNIESIQTNSEIEEDIITNKENKILCNLKDSQKSENAEKENDTSIKIGNKDQNDVEDTNLIGLPDKDYFENLITNNQGSQLFLREWFKFKDVIGDGNCGYRAIANQLFGNENYHNIIRSDVYNYLKLNSERFKELNFEVNGEMIDSEKYIKRIKKSGFWMGDLEMSVINKIYDVNFYLFEERNNYIMLLANWGNIYDNSKIFINICFVDNNHFNVLYEKKEDKLKINHTYNEDFWKKIKIKTMKKDKDLELDLQYVNDKRNIKYKDIYNYIKSKDETGTGIYPQSIYDIKEKNRRKNKKKDFRESIKDYYIDQKTKRLKIKYRDYSSKEYIKKDYFVAFQIEKNNIVKRLHDESIHKGQKSLYLLIRNGNYWWYGIYEDVKDYIKKCSICQQLHKSVNRKPDIKQIITKGPRERYVVDLVEINEEIQDSNKVYKYILNIIDHYSKLVGSYLLNKKTAKDVLNKINDFICHYGNPGILQCDHGKEFDNTILKEYCKDKNINLIYSGVRHPTTNGVVEAVHKDIVNSLKAEKLEKKNKYDINFSIAIAASAHNKNIHTVTKYSPEFLFYNNNEELSKDVTENMKKSQNWRKKKINPIKPNSKVLISIHYIRKGNTLYCNKLRETGKKCIPGIVSGDGSGSVYPVKINVNYKDLINNSVYNIDYHLVKEVNDSVYDKILRNFNSFISIFEDEEEEP